MKILKAPIKKEASELESKNRALARRAAAEGFVLLENDGVLPLKEKQIALYGAGARMTVKGGTGSGAVRERYSVTIEQGLKNEGYEIASTAWLDRFDRFYADSYEMVIRRFTFSPGRQVREMIVWMSREITAWMISSGKIWSLFRNIIKTRLSLLTAAA